MVNYFGRVKDVTKFEVSPILLGKGKTRIALYGIGNIRDERLARTFMKQGVTFLQPAQEQESKEEWFNILVLHQNRFLLV